MSDNIYEDPDSPSIYTRPCNKTKDIYLSAVPKRSQQRMNQNQVQDSSGGHNHRPYKLAVVFLGLLCVLLLAVISIGLFIRTEEARQLQLRYNNLTEEKDQLEILNNNLTRENKQLQERNIMLSSENSLLETISAMAGEQDELQWRLCKLVDVTLDPDTAHASLILSADGKRVRHGDTKQNVPDNLKRFSPVVSVLGKQGFSAGRFYYEVQVKGKTAWTLGVARESITRKGKISLSRKNGYWTIRLRNGTEYKALADPSVPLSLKEKPHRVGVFVDYEAGLVSFYDADCWYHLYSYNVKFTEKLYPFFSPGLNDGGKNSSPFIISSVSICPIN
ncbi:nuclear factor 7, ovary-like isoform X2 [Alosa sapidissima]|uniref:nuclear factor 7, ovary-like isoform X2 n=1 Tax=Alosa sapidissima TaxID=34773 RepID=UPI001C0840E9|nr:nuclear factor 7, ovary-like isoform X2 [Alosa sapidissima]